MSDMGHEQLVFCNDNEFGLKAVIAIHDTTLGPAMGGTRLWHYDNEGQAVKDALRLSRAMTLKNAIQEINIGGGKGVIMGNAQELRNERRMEGLMRRYGKFVNNLGGKYYAAEDVNMTARDMDYINMETKYVTGISLNRGGSGDPSPVTAYGVYLGMKAAANKFFGSDSLVGKKIAIQGAGNVATYLIDLLAKEKAEIYVSDIFDDKVQKVASNYKVNVVDIDQILEIECDIFAPCALGGVLNSQSISKLNCPIVCGGANNQLEDERVHSEMLSSRNILYAPDFLVNGGGITNVFYEYMGCHSETIVKQHVEHIYKTLIDVINLSEQQKISTHSAAENLALKRIREIGRLRARI